jgi:hypothetical protein
MLISHLLMAQPLRLDSQPWCSSMKVTSPPIAMLTEACWPLIVLHAGKLTPTKSLIFSMNTS